MSPQITPSGSSGSTEVNITVKVPDKTLLTVLGTIAAWLIVFVL